MSQWPTAPLRELCDIRIGRTPRRDTAAYWNNGTHPWVTIRDLDGNVVTSTRECISDAALGVMPPPVEAGTLLFSFKLTIGRTGVSGGPIHTNEAIAALPITCADRLDRDFLAFALQAATHDREANHAVLGKVLNKAQVGAIRIPLPPLADQRRIVDILNRANGICRLRREALEKARRIIPALFVEMFGDPEHTSLPVCELSRLIQEARPITYGILKPGPDEDEGVPYVRVVDIKEGRLHIRQLRRTSTAIAEQYRRSTLVPGDLLITIRGTVGRTAVVPRELIGANITQDTARASLTDEITAAYTQSFVDTPWAQRWMQSHTVGQTVRGLNLRDLRRLPVPVPLLSLQQAFSSRVADIQAMIAQQERSAAASERLVNSLMAEMFG